MFYRIHAGLPPPGRRGWIIDFAGAKGKIGSCNRRQAQEINMAYSSMQSSSGELFAAGTKESTLIQRVVHWARERIALYRAESELNHMSDAELSDIGLTRGEIHMAVRRGF
jgi:uncharacterized protein YjiS (DUF1127 family)